MSRVHWTLQIAGVARSYSTRLETHGDTLECIVGVPETLGAAYDVDGGVPQYDAFSVTVVDSTLLRTTPTQIESTGEEVLASADIVSFSTAPGYDPGTIIWVGTEAVRIDNIDGGSPTVADVTRGLYNTERQEHPANTPVWDSNPVILGRRVILTMFVNDTSTLVQEGFLNRIDCTDEGFVLQCIGQPRWFSREIPSIPTTVVIDNFSDTGVVTGSKLTGEWDGTNPVATTHMYLSMGDRHMRIDPDDVDSFFEFGAPSYYGDVLKPGDVATLTVAAEPGYSYFPPAGTNNWHPLSIALTLMLSSARASDGLFFANSTYSRLPIGYGLGIPQALVDVATFEAERDATPHYIVTNFRLGPEKKHGGEIIDELLKHGGWRLVLDNGLISVRRPGIYASRLNLPQITATTVMHPWHLSVESDGMSRDYSLETADGQFNMVLSAQSGVATFERSSEAVNCKLMHGGLAGWRIQRALHTINERTRATLKLEVQSANLDHLSIRAGDLVQVTLTGKINPLDGSRSLAGQWRVQDVDAHIAADQSSISLVLTQAYDVDTVATWAVSAATYSDDGVSVITVQDGFGQYFSVGDVVTFMAADGTPYGTPPGTQIVTDVTGDNVELDGDFGGTLSAYVLEQAQLVVTTSDAVYDIGAVLGDLE